MAKYCNFVYGTGENLQFSAHLGHLLTPSI